MCIIYVIIKYEQTGESLNYLVSGVDVQSHHLCSKIKKLKFQKIKSSENRKWRKIKGGEK